MRGGIKQEMKSQVEKLANKSFVRNVMVVATGTAMAQIIYMALSPIITRLYGPEAYGLMGAFMAVVTIMGPVTALTYPIAIVLPKKDEEAHGLIQLSFFISILSAGCLTLLLLLLQDQIVYLFKLEDISSFLFLLPFVALFSGILQIAENWLIRTKQFKVSANVAVLQAIILQGSMVLIGLLYPSASVLIILTAFGIGLKAIMMIILSKESLYLNLKIEKQGRIFVRKLAFKHKDFPIYRAPEVFLNAISQGLPILLLASFFSPASAGFYAICNTALSVPSQLIGKSVGDVLYPRLSEAAYKGEKVTDLIKNATFYLSIIGIFPFIFIIAFGPQLFSFVFGAEWATAGEYARWIALWSFFGFINKPSVLALPVLSAQAFQLKYTIFMLISRTFSLAAAYFLFSNDIAVIATFSIVGSFLNIGLIIFTLRISGKFDEKKELFEDY